VLAENGIQADLEAIEDLLQRADVLAVAFTTFSLRLLVDFRTTGDTGPLVTVVEPVTSVQERYRWLGRHRGVFGAPEAFSFFTWPQTVRTLVDRDVLATARERLAGSGPAATGQLDEALASLLRTERDAISAAVRGEDPWRTIWPRLS
jgi:hypothetical protein